MKSTTWPRPRPWASLSFGLAGVLLPMLQGTPPGALGAARARALAVVPPLVLAVVVLVLGVYVPRALADLLGRVAALVGGGA